VEMGLSVAGVPHRKGGVDAAMTLLEERTPSNSAAHRTAVGS
jgi:alanine-glyoxylate transaminase / serine-glyoxylate transaminase / serine-pyruvate transaminase